MYIKVIASQTWDVFETHCSLHVVAQAFCREINIRIFGSPVSANAGE